MYTKGAVTDVKAGDRLKVCMVVLLEKLFPRLKPKCCNFVEYVNKIGSSLFVLNFVERELIKAFCVTIRMRASELLDVISP